MSKSVGKHIIVEIQDYLGVTEEKSLNELYDLVFDARKLSHPDKCFTEETKKVAEEKLKILNSYFTTLKDLLEKDKLHAKGKEIAIYEIKEKDIDNKYRIKLLEDQLAQSSDTIHDLNKEISVLKEKIENQINLNIKHTNKDIENIYMPKSGSYITLSVTLLLSILGAIAVNIEKLKTPLLSIFPFDPKYLSYALLLSFFAICLNIIVKVRKNHIVALISAKMKSTVTVNEFVRQYKKPQSYNDDFYYSFMENNITEFIREKFCNPTYKPLLRKSIPYFGLVLGKNDDQAISYIKDSFIFSLLQKKLIVIGNPKDLDREFIIIK